MPQWAFVAVPVAVVVLLLVVAAVVLSRRSNDPAPGGEGTGGSEPGNGVGVAAEGTKPDSIDATKLIGKWRLKGIPDESRVYDFGTDGRMVVTAGIGGFEETEAMTYKLDGATLTLTRTVGGQEVTHTVVVSELTDDEMVVRVNKGAEKADTFVRVVVRKDVKIDAAKLVGRWKGWPEERRVVEFTKDGKLTVTTWDGDKESKVESTYKTDGNKLIVRLTVGGKEVVRERTITELTDAEFVSTDEKGQEDVLSRVNDNK